MRRNRNQSRTIRSVCGDIVMRGTTHQLIEKYEGLAYQAQREKDHVNEHLLFQHADHYKREVSNVALRTKNI